MRVVVLALTLALVAGQHPEFAPHFQPNKLYEYKYEAVVVGKLPEDTRSGLKMSSKVHIGVLRDDQHILKLEDVKFFEYGNAEYGNRFIPAKIYALESQLMKPIKFRYENGEVKQVSTADGVSVQAQNIVKGILNLLQVKVKKTLNIYEVYEDGTQGECKNLYVIPEEESSERMQLMKTRDLEHCRERNMKFSGLAYTTKLAKSQQDSHEGQNLKGVTTYQYDLKMADRVQIMAVNATEVIEFVPVQEMKGVAEIMSEQILILHNILDGSLDEPTHVHYSEEQRSLKYKFSTEHLQTPINLLQPERSQHQIEEYLRKLSQFNVNQVNENAPELFLALIHNLRRVSYDELKNILEKHWSVPQYRSLLLKTIPAIGTNVALKFIHEKLLHGSHQLSAPELIQLLIGSFHMVTADPEAVELLEQLAFSQELQQALRNEYPGVRELLMLGYGTMISKYSAEQHERADQYVKRIRDQLNRAVEQDDLHEILLLLKVLGNTGHPAAIKSISKCLLLPVDKPEVKRIRTEAIGAMKNIAKKHHRMIEETVLPLYLDKHLDSELRILASWLLFESKPRLTMVSTMVRSLRTERDIQVASFVHSLVWQMAHSNAAVHAELAQASKIALKLLRQKQTLNLRRRWESMDFAFSKAIHVDLYNNSLKLGADGSLVFVNDEATLFPKMIVAKSSGYFSGATADVLEVGVKMEGLQEALRKKEIIDSPDRLTKMQRILSTLGHFRNLPARGPLFSAYAKVFGQEIAFVNIDKPMIVKAVELAKNAAQHYGRNFVDALLSGDARYSESFLNPVLVAEMKAVIPTIGGIPFEMSLSTAAVAAADVQVHIASAPKEQAQHGSEDDLLKRKYQLETEIRPRIDMTTFAVMGTNTEALQVAILSKAKFSSFVPAKISAGLDITEGNFKIDILPVSMPRNLIDIEVETIPVARNIDNKTVNLEDVSSQQELSSVEAWSQKGVSQKFADIKKWKAAKKTRCVKILGAMQLCLSVATNTTASRRDKALYKMTGKHALSVSLKPIEGEHVEKLQMEVQVGPNAAKKMMKQVNQCAEEITEVRPILTKLRRIFAHSPFNHTTLAFSSSRVSSSSSSSSRSSHPTSTAVDAVIQAFGLQRHRSSRSSSSSSRSGSSSSSGRSKIRSSSRRRRGSRRSSKRRSSSSISSSSRTIRSSSSSSSRSHHRRVEGDRRVRSSSSSSSSSSSRSHHRRVEGDRRVGSSSSSSRKTRSRRSSSSSRKSRRSSSSSSSRRSRSNRASNRASRRNSARSYRSSSASSASSLMSIFSSSSSSSSRSSYSKNSQRRSASLFVSRSASSRASNSREKSFDDPKVTILLKVIRADNKPQGYQLTTYMDQSSSKLYMILADLAEDWMLRADLVPRLHRAIAKIRWGQQCRGYNTTITAEAGLVGSNPAARLKMQWMNTRKFSPKYENSTSQISFTLVAKSEKTIELIVKENRVIYKKTIELPIRLPLKHIDDLTPINGLTNKASYLFAKAGSAQCMFDGSTLVTFNNKRLQDYQPLPCYQVLAQDCTGEVKFIVLLKKDEHGQHHISAKIADFDLDLYPMDAEVVVKVNNREIPRDTQLYVMNEGAITIKRRGQGISVIAGSFGLNELYFDKTSWRVDIEDWMRGRVCGICGMADGQVSKEFFGPNGHEIKDPASFSHSWILSAQSCRDNSECRLRLETLQIQRQFHGQQMTCSSTERVLQCLPGCSPVRTTPVTVGFYCKPAGHQDSSEVTSVHQRKPDLMETIQAHVSCSCNAQCA